MEQESEQDKGSMNGLVMLNSKLQSMMDTYIVTHDAEAIEAEERQRHLEAEMAKREHMEHCGIGEKYQNVTWDDYKPQTEEQVNNLKVIKKFITDVRKGKGRTLWLCGENGNAKTMLGGLICRDCFGQYARVYDIEDELEDARSFSSKTTRKEIFRKYRRVPVLVLDELGRFPSENEKHIVFHVYNDRYEDGKSTVLITNMSKVDTCKYLGKAIVDRSIETNTCLTYTGESYRKIKRHEVLEEEKTESSV